MRDALRISVSRPLRFAYLGNFTLDFCTESHVAASIESLGHHVTRIQEGSTPASDIPPMVAGHDVFLWTQTYGLAETGGARWERELMLSDIKQQGVPTVAYHLDRWWGLGREDQVANEPFFKCDLVCTADGGHDAEWASAGVNHLWFPPGVYHAEAVDVEPQPRFRAEVIFVGSWQHYGHPEHWPYRQQLIANLRTWFGRRFVPWPRGRAIRGRDLNALYASAKVVVGDSCISGGITNYWSDRIPETLGRGGFLIHPYVEGLEDHFTPDEHLVTYPPGEWGTLQHRIRHYLAIPDVREEIRAAGAAHARANHTYAVRMQQLIDALSERSLLASVSTGTNP